MLHMISWKEYWTLMGLGLIVYYGWLLLKYFPTWRMRTNTSTGSRSLFIAEEFKDTRKRAAARTGEPKREDIGKGEPTAGPAVGKTESVLSEKVMDEMAEKGKELENQTVTEQGDPTKEETEGKEILLHRALVEAHRGPGDQVQGERSQEESAGGDGSAAPLPKGSPLPAQSELPLPVGNVDLAVAADQLAKEAREMIQGAAAAGKTAEGELIFLMQKLLSKEEYQALRNTPFEERMSKMIGDCLTTECSIRLDAERLKGLWIR